MALAEELVNVGMPAQQAVVVVGGTVAAVTATGSSTTLTAVVIKAGVNRVTGSDGVKLPAMNLGSSVLIVNDTGSTVKVWPPAGGAIQIPGTSFGLAVADAAYSLTQFQTAQFTCVVGGAASLFATNKSNT
jgi:hypothetical protein